MKTITILAVATLFSLTIYAQDKIIRKNNSKVFCSITTIDAEKIYFTTEKNGKTRETYILKTDVIKYKKDGNMIFIDETKNKKKAKANTPKEPKKSEEEKSKVIL